MTFDGTQVYVYDAWNRLVEVHHGYWDGYVVQTGERFDTFAYDGLGRRISEVVSGEGSGQDQPTDYYFSAQGQIIEERRNADDIIRENVWGLEYVNELVQTSVVMNPESHYSNYLGSFSVMQDANWNVIGIVDSDGNLAERYTYDPYGNRQTYVSGGSDDPTLMTPINPASRALDADGNQNYPTMEFGFQGMLQDQATGLILSPTRPMSTVLGVWMQEEPAGGAYVDGQNLYQAFGDNPIAKIDPTGRSVFYWGGPIENLVHYGAHASLIISSGGLILIPMHYIGTDQEFGQGSYPAKLIQNDPLFQYTRSANIDASIISNMETWSRATGCETAHTTIDTDGFFSPSIFSAPYVPGGFSSTTYDLVGQLTLGRYGVYWQATGSIDQHVNNHDGWSAVYVEARFDVNYSIDDRFDPIGDFVPDVASWMRHIRFGEHVTVGLVASCCDKSRYEVVEIKRTPY